MTIVRTATGTYHVPYCGRLKSKDHEWSRQFNTSNDAALYIREVHGKRCLSCLPGKWYYAVLRQVGVS